MYTGLFLLDGVHAGMHEKKQRRTYFKEKCNQYSDALTGHTDKCVCTDSTKPTAVSKQTIKKPVMTKS